MRDAVLLFEKLLERNYSPEQVQEFIPLPMTRACVQYVDRQGPADATRSSTCRAAGASGACRRRSCAGRIPTTSKLVLEALREAARPREPDLDVFNPGALLPAIGQRVLTAAGASPSFELTMARKDARLMLEAAGSEKLIVLPGVATAMDRALAAGRGASDFAVFARP
jgi:hypothetical protein